MPRRRGVIFTPENVRRVSIQGLVNVRSAGRPYFYHAKIHLNSTPSHPLARTAAQRVFLKPILGTNAMIQVSQKRILICEKLRKAGFPVLKMGIISIQHPEGIQYFIASSPFLTKGGKETKLVPINDTMQGRPTFLAKLDPAKDCSTIEQTAVLGAKLLNRGVNYSVFDFLGFYRTSKGWKPIIMDADSLYEDPDPYERRLIARQTLDWVREAIPAKSPVYQIFEKAFWHQLHPELRPDL